MSDLVANIRTIGSYPAATLSQPTDTLLTQRGGSGGAYYSVTAQTLLATALSGSGGSVGIGLPLPGDAQSTGIIASNLTTPPGCTMGWNWYHTASGTSYLNAGYALQQCFTGTGYTINVAPSGSPGQPVTAWSQVLNLALNGNLTIPGTITMAAAASTTQAATLGQVNAAVAAAVVSWNGRTGAVTLNLTDVTAVG